MADRRNVSRRTLHLNRDDSLDLVLFGPGPEHKRIVSIVQNEDGSLSIYGSRNLTLRPLAANAMELSQQKKE